LDLNVGACCAWAGPKAAAAAMSVTASFARMA
jgi:hypothetical protein